MRIRKKSKAESPGQMIRKCKTQESKPNGGEDGIVQKTRTLVWKAMVLRSTGRGKKKMPTSGEITGRRGKLGNKKKITEGKKKRVMGKRGGEKKGYEGGGDRRKKGRQESPSGKNGGKEKVGITSVPTIKKKSKSTVSARNKNLWGRGPLHLYIRNQPLQTKRRPNEVHSTTRGDRTQKSSVRKNAKIKPRTKKGRKKDKNESGKEATDLVQGGEEKNRAMQGKKKRLPKEGGHRKACLCQGAQHSDGHDDPKERCDWEKNILRKGSRGGKTRG